MAAAPVHSETIPFKAAAFDKFPVRAGIDRGCSLTKVVFVPKDAAAKDPDTVPLRCLTFRNADFEDALRAMKDQAQLPESGEIHVTGLGCANYKDTIKEILGLDTLFIDEFATLGSGPFLLINNAKPQDVFHPDPEIRKFEIHSEMFDKFLSSMKGTQIKDDEEDPLFPAMVVYVGSGAGIMNVSKEGITKFLGGVAMSGRPFLGLAKVVVGTNDYEEIMELANKGDQCKVDFQIKDIMKDDPNSPYGQFPPEMPIFPFAKASEAGWSLNHCSRQDLAQALVSLFAADIMTVLYNAIQASGLKRIYLAGNFFRANIVRKLLYERMAVFAKGLDIKIKAIKTGHTGAISAMLTNKEDVPKLVQM